MKNLDTSCQAAASIHHHVLSRDQAVREQAAVYDDRFRVPSMCSSQEMGQNQPRDHRRLGKRIRCAEESCTPRAWVRTT